MRKFYLFLVLFVEFFKPSVSFAQAGVPAVYRPSYNAMMSRSFANMSMRNMMNMSMNRSFGYMLNQKYKFKVLMKDSSVKEIKSTIHLDTVLHKSYLTYDDKTIKDKKLREQRIYSNQTICITRTDYNTDITGMANDSCWLFKVVKGKISAYSPLSESYNIDSFYLRAFQLADGPVQKIDSVSLAPILKGNEKAYKAFIKKDYYKAINKYNSSKENK
jgi:hypothetical protein